MSYADTTRCLTCLNYATKRLRHGNTSFESTDPGTTDVLEQRNKLLAFGYLLCILLGMVPQIMTQLKKQPTLSSPGIGLLPLPLITRVRVDATKLLKWIFKQTGCGDFQGNLSRSVNHSHNNNHDYVWLRLCRTNFVRIEVL
jgi:hypothetical protein